MKIMMTAEEMERALANTPRPVCSSCFVMTGEMTKCLHHGEQFQAASGLSDYQREVMGLTPRPIQS